MLTLGRGEVNDVAIALEHVDLLNRLDGLDVHLLERGLQLLVVGARVLVHLLDLPSGRALATVSPYISHCSLSTSRITQVYRKSSAG